MFVFWEYNPIKPVWLGANRLSVKVDIFQTYLQTCQRSDGTLHTGAKKGSVFDRSISRN